MLVLVREISIVFPTIEERYISFTKRIQVGSNTKKVKNKEGETKPLHHQMR